MTNNEDVCKLLIKTGAFKDLDEPVILTSGELGIYYVNTEKLCMDGGKFNEFGDDSEAMSKHAFNMMKIHPEFNEVVDVLARKAAEYLSDSMVADSQSEKVLLKKWLEDYDCQIDRSFSATE